MNGSLDKSVLDEELGGEIEYLSLVERIRWLDGATDGEETCREAAQVLRELRDLLLASKLWTKSTISQSLGGELLEALVIQHTHQVGPQKFIQLDLVSSLEGEEGQYQHLQRGNLAAANLLESAILVLDTLRPDPRAEDLLKRICSKVRVSRSATGERDHHLHCDGIRHEYPCWRKSPSSFSEEEASLSAKRAGWLVSEEKDLCPDCWSDLDPEAANAAAPSLNSPYSDAGLAQLPVFSLNPEVEGVLQFAGLLQGYLTTARTVEGFVTNLREMFGEALGQLLQGFPTDERIFEILREHEAPVLENESAVREVLAALRELADPLPEPPVPV